VPELPSGVGLTAVGVAYIRAGESQRDDRLFDDQLAARFVAASGWSVPDGAMDADEATRGYWGALVQWVVVRTRFLDEQVLEAAANGCRQFVLLGAGLDTRAFRLDWPAGAYMFELDLPDVLGFKENVLRDSGAVARCARTAISTDLLGAWPEALTSGGFRADRPAMWVAEGLLIYLTPEQNDTLLREVTKLSAAGSVLALTLRTHSDREPVIDQSMAEGPTREPTFRTMWKSRAPDDPAGWLEEHGWDAESFDAYARATDYGRPIPRAPEQRTALLVRAFRRG